MIKKQNIKGSHVLIQGKYEQVHKNRISIDQYIDCQRSKEIFDLFLAEKKLVGFLQIIYQSPYGLIFISQLQVREFKKLNLIQK